MPCPPERHFHDEPFVIDNAPLGIDVGSKHADLTHFKDGVWTRECSVLTRIVAIKKETSRPGEVEIEGSDLDKSREIIVLIQDGKTLKLKWVGDDIEIRPVSFEFKQHGRRLTQPGSLRIQQVTWFDKAGGKHVFNGTSTHDSIVVGLTK
jgi:hypothetical protein